MRAFFKRNRQNFWRGILASFLNFVLLSCSSSQSSKNSQHQPKPRVNHAGQSSPWDYQRIREQKESEEALGWEKERAFQRQKEEDSSCVILSKSQMIRARRSGCRPLEARAGYGEEAYCCPPSASDR